MNILLSNDDGVNAEGIYAAYQALKDIADVTIVAPAENNSSIGHKLTLFKHLELKKTKIQIAKEALQRVNDSIPEQNFMGGLHTITPNGVIVAQGPWNRADMNRAIGTLKDDFQ